jgi:hypothetical protein
VMDFFAILMPGAILAYVLMDYQTSIFGTALPELKTEAAKWFAFIVASYVLGHVLHHIGASLDWFYDEFYVKRWKRRNGEERLLTITKQLMKSTLDEYAGITSAFSWAGSYVRVRSDAANKELERGGADSKFFRSLCLVALISMIVFAAKDTPRGVIVSGFVALFSFWRFCSLRWKNSQLTYEYFILLSGSGFSTPGKTE